jgi:hypothetical protein
MIKAQPAPMLGQKPIPARSIAGRTIGRDDQAPNAGRRLTTSETMPTTMPDNALTMKYSVGFAGRSGSLHI